MRVPGRGLELPEPPERLPPLLHRVGAAEIRDEPLLRGERRGQIGCGERVDQPLRADDVPCADVVADRRGALAVRLGDPSPQIGDVRVVRKRGEQRARAGEIAVVHRRGRPCEPVADERPQQCRIGGVEAAGSDGRAARSP